MKKKIFISLLYLLPLFVFSQNWVQVGLGAYNYGVNKLYADATNNILYAAGNFRTSGIDTIKGVAKWNGTNWDSLRAGLNYPPEAMAFYNGELYACGGFTKSGSLKTKSIAKWNGIKWDSLNKSTGAYVFSTHIYNNELYFGGMFAPIDSTFSKAIVRRIGNSWYSLGNPQWTLVQVKAIQNYNGEIYAGGFFDFDDGNTSTQHIARWNGSKWNHVANGIRCASSFDIPVSKMMVYQSKLYVAGTFQNTSPNCNVGNNIMSWDGSSFSDVGGGVTGTINDMVIFNNKLYVVGNFSQAGGINANNIAYWDGTNWCGTGSTFSGSIYSIEVYNNELYIGGGFTLIDGNPVNYIAKWIGGNFVDQCGNTIGIKEKALSPNKISIYPNPVSNILQLQSEQTEFENSEIEITNCLGQIVLILPFQKEVDVSDLTSGYYTLKIITSSKQEYYSKFIKNEN